MHCVCVYGKSWTGKREFLRFDTCVDCIPDEGVLGALDPHHSGKRRARVHPDPDPHPRPVRRQIRIRRCKHVLPAQPVKGNM
jgi:hypothetical protein